MYVLNLGPFHRCLETRSPCKCHHQYFDESENAVGTRETTIGNTRHPSHTQVLAPHVLAQDSRVLIVQVSSAAGASEDQPIKSPSRQSRID